MTRQKHDYAILERKEIGIMDTLTVNVFGKVFNPKIRIDLPHADVRLSNNQNLYTANCDKNGEFKFTHIPSGKYQIRVSFIGYTGLTDSVEFKTGEIVELNIKMWTYY
ncbi:hypothetical protein GCM10027293_26880 [Pontibacter aydingkolensis]